MNIFKASVIKTRVTQIYVSSHPVEFLIGYVVIQVEGLSLEKFINLTVVNNIYLWVYAGKLCNLNC